VPQKPARMDFAFGGKLAQLPSSAAAMPSLSSLPTPTLVPSALACKVTAASGTNGKDGRGRHLLLWHFVLHTITTTWEFYAATDIDGDAALEKVTTHKLGVVRRVSFETTSWSPHQSSKLSANKSRSSW
jgi:hypothetical protein